jgi:ATP-binding cassette subfamily C protein CydD
MIVNQFNGIKTPGKTSLHIERLLLNQARSVKGIYSLAIGLGVIDGLLVVFQARKLSQAVSNVFISHQHLDLVLPILGSLLGIILVRMFVMYISDLLTCEAVLKIKYQIRELILDHLAKVGPAHLQKEHSAELTTTAMESVEALDAYFSQYLPQLVFAAVIPLIIVFFVFPLDLVTILVFVLTAPLIPLFMYLIGSISDNLVRKQWTGLQRLGVHFLDTIQGLAALKTLNRSKAQANRIFEISEEYRKVTLVVLRVTFLSALILEVLATISIAIVAVAIALRLLIGRMGFEEAFFILIIAPEFYLPLRLLGQKFHAGNSGVTAAKRIFEILNIRTTDKDLPAIRTHNMEWQLPEEFSFEFRNVSFSYPDRIRPALSEITFNWRSREMIALVGPSGAGKSTLAKLLVRFLEPDEGQILLNGLPFQTIPAELWRKQVAWVPQHAYLFYGSIKDNLRLGKPEASLEEIESAAHFAGLDADVRKLPDGYDTFLGEGGSRISAGMAQRVGIARAFLVDAPIVILDEPTANLDLQRESELENVISHLFHKKTVLVIAHRLTTIYRADKILVMDCGRIVEAGVHKELINTQGAYYELVNTYREAV